jgi:hypothetical protein
MGSDGREAKLQAENPVVEMKDTQEGGNEDAQETILEEMKEKIGGTPKKRATRTKKVVWVVGKRAVPVGLSDGSAMHHKTSVRRKRFVLADPTEDEKPEDKSWTTSDESTEATAANSVYEDSAANSPTASDQVGLCGSEIPQDSLVFTLASNASGVASPTNTSKNVPTQSFLQPSSAYFSAESSSSPRRKTASPDQTSFSDSFDQTYFSRQPQALNHIPVPSSSG